MELSSGGTMKLRFEYGYAVLSMRRPGSSERAVRLLGGDVGELLVWLRTPFGSRRPLEFPAVAGDDMYPYDAKFVMTHPTLSVVSPCDWYAKVTIDGIDTRVDQYELEVLEAALRSNSWRLLQ